MSRGKRLLDPGSDPSQVLHLFSERFPNACGVDCDQLAMDKLAMKAIVKTSGAVKGTGGGSSACPPPPGVGTVSRRRSARLPGGPHIR